jgi:hypothetical protein
VNFVSVPAFLIATTPFETTLMSSPTSRDTSLSQNRAGGSAGVALAQTESTHTEAYVLGFQAARHEGPYAQMEGDIQCPYDEDSTEAGDWQRGYDAASSAQDAAG